MYTDPPDRYGRLTSERFFAARTLVDTGLTMLGWSRDRAAARPRGAASYPSPRSPANCRAMRSTIQARHWGTTRATGTCANYAAPRTYASSTTRCSPADPSRCGYSESPWLLLGHPATLSREPPDPCARRRRPRCGPLPRRNPAWTTHRSGAQPPGDGGAGPALCFQLPGEALDVGAADGEQGKRPGAAPGLRPGGLGQLRVPAIERKAQPKLPSPSQRVTTG